MRKRRCLKLLLGSLLLASGAQVANAQDAGTAAPEFSGYHNAAAETGFGVPGPGPYGAPDQTFFVPEGMAAAPPGYIDPASGGVPPYSFGNAGYPSPAQPWPTVTPYQYPLDQHYNKKGLWFRDITHRQQNEYEFSVEGLIGKYADPSSELVGFEKAPQADFFVGITTATDITRNQRIAQGLIVPTLGLANRSFPGHSTRNLNSTSADGVRLRWAMTKPDDSGWSVESFWLNEGRDSWSPFDIPGRDDVDITQRTFAGLPIDTGVPFELLPEFLGTAPPIILPGNPAAQPLEFTTGLRGSVIVYDLYYSISTQTQAWGSGAHYYGMPWWETGAVKLRPLVGGRYMQVNESFGFFGAESGDSYVFDPFSQRPIVTTVIEGPGYTSSLTSETESHLAGPEMGFRLDLGGDKFKISTHTKFGLMANHQETQVRGRNIAEQFPLRPPTTAPPTAPAPFELAHERLFSDTSSSTYVSPMFEQSIFFDLPVFGFIPVLKNWDMFDEAKLRIGYTLTAVANMVRPHNSIAWQGNLFLFDDPVELGLPPRPIYPEVALEKHTWYTHYLSIGVDWEY